MGTTIGAAVPGGDGYSDLTIHPQKTHAVSKLQAPHVRHRLRRLLCHFCIMSASRHPSARARRRRRSERPPHEDPNGDDEVIVIEGDEEHKKAPLPALELQDARCPVCYEFLVQSREPKMLPCKHKFCAVCIARLVRVMTFVECPICRKHTEQHAIRVITENHSFAKQVKAMKVKCEEEHNDCDWEGSPEDLARHAEDYDRIPKMRRRYAMRAAGD